MIFGKPYVTLWLNEAGGFKEDCMEAVNYMQGEVLEEHLKELFGGKSVVTAPEFKSVMGISDHTLLTMRRQGRAPRMIPLAEGSGEGRFFLKDIARWIENIAGAGLSSEKRGRGRPRKAVVSRIAPA